MTRSITCFCTGRKSSKPNLFRKRRKKSICTFVDGCTLSGLHSLRKFLDGCAQSGLHSLRKFLDNCAQSNLHSLRSSRCRKAVKDYQTKPRTALATLAVHRCPKKDAQ